MGCLRCPWFLWRQWESEAFFSLVDYHLHSILKMKRYHSLSCSAKRILKCRYFLTSLCGTANILHCEWYWSHELTAAKSAMCKNYPYSPFICFVGDSVVSNLSIYVIDCTHWFVVTCWDVKVPSVLLRPMTATDMWLNWITKSNINIEETYNQIHN